MSNFILHSIEIFDNLLFLNCTYLNNFRRVNLSFSIVNNKLIINFDEKNSFLQFYQFNDLSIETFLSQLINKDLPVESIHILEEELPF